MAEPLLRIENITKHFGSLIANEDVSFNIYPGEIVSLIGPNGAGKTTLFNVISGFYPPTKGKIYFRALDITGKRVYDICKLGITRTFQIVQTLFDMTVSENVMIGAFLHTNDRKEALKEADRILEITGLLEKRDVLGRNLTIVDKKRVEIARAMATGPELLMLDECMAGLNQTEIKEVMRLCTDLRGEGLSLLIVEHIMEAIMPISDRIVVLNAGRKIAEGLPEEIANNTSVIEAYLGGVYSAEGK